MKLTRTILPSPAANFSVLCDTGQTKKSEQIEGRHSEQHEPSSQKAFSRHQTRLGPQTGNSIFFDFSPISVQIVFGRIAANLLITLDLRELAKYFTGH